MDQENNPILDKLRSDPLLVQMLADKDTQQYIVQLIKQEEQFQQNSRSRQQNHHKRNRNGDLFQKENRQLSPLESKIVEGTDSKEQHLLRRLLQLLTGGE